MTFSTDRLYPIDDYEPILDAEGNRIGIMTRSGPVYAASQQAIDDIIETRRKGEEKKISELVGKGRKAHALGTEKLKDLASVSPGALVSHISELTGTEQKAVEISLKSNRGGSVSLPVATSELSKYIGYRECKRHTNEVAMGRAFRRLYNRGLATVEKRADGLIWLTISIDRIRTLLRSKIAAERRGGADDINLIKVPCKNQTLGSGHPSKPRPDPTAIPKNASGHRLCACRLLTGVKMLDKRDHAEVDDYFLRYLDSTEDKIIALLDGASGETVGAEYSTRFNDIAKAAKNLEKFDYALEHSFREHSKAVFLTLTTDPNLRDEDREAARQIRLQSVLKILGDPTTSGKRLQSAQKRYWSIMGPDAEIEELERRRDAGTIDGVGISRLRSLLADREHAGELRRQLEDPAVGVRTKEKIIQALKRMGRWEYRWDPDGFTSAWDANRSFGKSWNKFMSYCKKICGDRRPPYISAFEFTDTGLLHIHVLIFVDYLASVDAISREWRRIGQGEIAYIYTLHATRRRDGPGYEWRWNAKARPEDAKGMSGGDYLKKYVRKAMLALMDDFTPSAQIQSLYWAYNKRFNSCSRSLMEGYEEASEREERTAPSTWGLWKIMSTFDAEESGVRIAYRRVTRQSMAERREALAEGGERV